MEGAHITCNAISERCGIGNVLKRIVLQKVRQRNFIEIVSPWLLWTLNLTVQLFFVRFCSVLPACNHQWAWWSWLGFIPILAHFDLFLTTGICCTFKIVPGCIWNFVSFAWQGKSCHHLWFLKNTNAYGSQSLAQNEWMMKKLNISKNAVFWAHWSWAMDNRHMESRIRWL